jgi:hypothetical protein
MDTRLLDALRIAPSLDLYELSLAISQMLADPRRILEVRRHLHLGAQVSIVADPAQHAEQAPQVPLRRADVAALKFGDTVSFTDKYLRERIGTITHMNTTTYSLICDGEQWRVSLGLLRKVIDL